MHKLYSCLVLVLLFSSCSIHKRKHLRGWHVEWAHNKNKNTESGKKQGKTESLQENSLAKLTHKTDDTTHIIPVEDIDHSRFLKNKIVAKSAILSSFTNTTAQIKKSSAWNSLEQKKNVVRKKRQFPNLPVYLFILAPLLIFAAIVVANNFVFQFALLVFAAGIAAFILSVIFAIRNLKKSKREESDIKRPTTLYWIIIAFSLLVLATFAFGVGYLLYALLFIV